MLGEIDLSIPIPKIELFLAKPNRKIIATLNESYNKEVSFKLGNVNELTFSLPYEIDVNHVLVKNPHVDILRDRYLIKLEYHHMEEWYIITNIVENSEDNDSLDVTCYLLPYKLKDTPIRIYEQDAINIYQVMNGGTYTDSSGISEEIPGILNETTWTLGYVDADIATKYRGYSFSSTTVLDAILQIAETLNALIIWDTENKKISFRNAETYGIDRGLVLSYGRYLRSLSRESNGDEMVTRLKLFGKEDLSIQSINPTGQNYIEDYSFFMYPFSRDENHNVTKSSYYMSDELCHAILDYTEYVEYKNGNFSKFLEQKSSIQKALDERNLELVALKEEMIIIENNLDLANSMNHDSSTYVTKKNEKQQQIDAKTNEINALNATLNSVNKQINDLKGSLQYGTFFTDDLIKELHDNYVIYSEFHDEKYILAEDLMQDGKKQFEKLKQPQVVLNISLIDFMKIVEAQKDWDKLRLGDTVTIKYEKMGIEMSAKIIEIEISEDGEEITLTIANTKDLLSDEERLIKLLYQNSSASTQLDMNKSKWDGIEATKSQVEEFYNGAISAVKNKIEAGIDSKLTITERGLLSQTIDDENSYLIIQNGILASTNDHGNTWKHAFTPEGCCSEEIRFVYLKKTRLK